MNITSLISILIGLIGILIAIIITKHYAEKHSSLIEVASENTAREKYKITESLVFSRKKNGSDGKPERLDLKRMVLEKSSVEDAIGFADLLAEDKNIKVMHYGALFKK